MATAAPAAPPAQTPPQPAAFATAAVSGLAAVGNLQADFSIGFGVFIIFLSILALVLPPKAVSVTAGSAAAGSGAAGPGTPGSRPWGAGLLGVAFGAGLIALGTWTKKNKTREALMGGIGVMRMI